MNKRWEVVTMEKEEKIVFSSQRGVTLIALIITIIVLLILARSNNKLSSRR